MAFRTGWKRRVTGVSRFRKKAIWVNVPFGNVAFTEAVGNQVLVVPEDWEAQFGGNANETCSLRAIVGELNWVQTVVGTAGGNAFWGIYISDKDATVVPTFAVAGMADVDWLRTGARSTTASVTASVLQSTVLGVQPIMIKARRKLKSRDSIYIAAQFGADAASPAGVLGGLLRFLIARD